MPTIYWTHDDSTTTIHRWNGATVDSFVMDPWVEMGNLFIGKGGVLVVPHWPETPGQYAFTLQADMTTKMTFPVASVGGTALYHDSLYGLSCYDAANDCYWFSLDPTQFSSLSGGVANPLWAKHSTVDGSLISVHADDASFPHIASSPNGQKTQIHNGYLYWTSKYETGFSGSGAQALHRMNTTTYDWEWCWSYPQGGTADAANSRWFLGFNGDDLWMQWYDPVNTDVWFERYDLSALTWSDHTSSTAQGLPAYVNRWAANPDEGAGQQAGSTALNGWVTIEGGTIYYGGYNNSVTSVWTMAPTTGAMSELFLTGTGEYVMGMAVEANLVGQLYVNLSHEQENPNWISVCNTGEWMLGNQVTQYANGFSASDYPDRLMDNDPDTKVTLGSENDIDLYMVGDMSSATEFWIVIDAEVTGNLTFHMTIYPPSPAGNWAVRISPLAVTGGERYAHKIVLSDNYANTGTWVGHPNYPQTQEDQTDWLKTAFANGYNGIDPYTGQHEVTIDLYQYSTETNDIPISKFGIFDAASLETGLGHFNLSTDQSAPDWWIFHQENFWINVSTTGTPEWWRGCTHF